jgi:GDP-L-fucose synthase
MNKKDKIYIAGHKGMVGSAIERRLRAEGYQNLLLRSKDELDLCNQQDTFTFIENEKPDYVIIAAAKVGGIAANATFKAQFLYENMMIQNNLMHASYLNQVKKLLFLGSSCIYPRLCPQPIKEEYMLTGALEPTNDAYAIAKISGIKMCEFYAQQYGCNFIAAMPTNLYGPNDNFNLVSSHVLPGILRKMHLARCLENGDLNAIRVDVRKRPVKGISPSPIDEKLLLALSYFGITKDEGNNNEVSLALWGSGTALREFLHVDDLARACVIMMNHFDNPFLRINHDPTDNSCFLNIGSGDEHTIAELAEIVKQVTRFEGKIVWDHSNPDGTPRKLMDSTKIAKLGWKPVIPIREGVEEFYKYYTFS